MAADPAPLPRRRKIDFAVGGVASLGAVPYSRPFQVLVDKDAASGILCAAKGPEQERPGSEAFEECTNWFWAAALMQAKLILRGERWLAKGRDGDLKVQLLQMIAWDHKARYGWSYETWFGGKRIAEGADRDVLADLDSCWAGIGRGLEQDIASKSSVSGLFDATLTSRSADGRSSDSVALCRASDALGGVADCPLPTGHLFHELTELVAERNGFLAFESKLHVFDQGLIASGGPSRSGTQARWTTEV